VKQQDFSHNSKISNVKCNNQLAMATTAACGQLQKQQRQSPQQQNTKIYNKISNEVVVDGSNGISVAFDNSTATAA